MLYIHKKYVMKKQDLFEKMILQEREGTKFQK